MPHQKLTDAKIIEAVQGSRELETAVRYLYQTHYGCLANFVKMNSGSEQDAEDYFHEVLLVFIELVRQGKFRTDCSIKTFLYAIMRNLWLKELRRRNRALHREMQYYESTDKTAKDLQDVLWEHESKRRLLRWIEQLGEKNKKLLVLFYYEQMPMKEIFRVMGYESEQVARNMKCKCMKKLNKLINSSETARQSFKELLIS